MRTFYASSQFYRPFWYALVYLCVCVRASQIQTLPLPIAERVGHTSSSLCDCSPLTPLIGNFGMFGLEAQSRPPGLRREQSGRPVHKSDRCTRCHYPPLIIILPVIVPLSASLAVHPAWVQNICTLALWGAGTCSQEDAGLYLLFVSLYARARICISIWVDFFATVMDVVKQQHASVGMTKHRYWPEAHLVNSSELVFFSFFLFSKSY